MKIKQKKQILHDMFIQICMEEIDRQKHIAIGAPIPEIMSESEKSLSIYSKIPVLGGLALVGQAYNINQEQVFAQRINKAFAPFRNNNIKLLLSGAITEVINSIKTILDSYNDQQEI